MNPSTWTRSTIQPCTIVLVLVKHCITEQTDVILRKITRQTAYELAFGRDFCQSQQNYMHCSCINSFKEVGALVGNLA